MLHPMNRGWVAHAFLPRFHGLQRAAWPALPVVRGLPESFPTTLTIDPVPSIRPMQQDDEEIRTVWRGRYLEMKKAGRWEYAARVHETAAAMIFALTPEGRLLLVEEYRAPIQRLSICAPAGLCGDEKAESGEMAARRELLEETGYEADEMEYLFTGPSSPGLTSEQIAFYRARGLRRIGRGGGVGNEQITVHEVPLSEVEGWLAEQQRLGKAIDPRIFTGLYFLLRDR